MAQQAGTAQEKTLTGIRRRILRTIAIHTTIIVTVGIIVVLLAATVLPKLNDTRACEASVINRFIASRSVAAQCAMLNVLSKATVPLGLYFIGGFLILTSLVGALNMYRVHTIKSTDAVFNTANPINVQSFVEKQEAKRFPGCSPSVTTTTNCGA
ncbi:uncharacterized protein LOC129588009 [Paramacrobiotus metropolitanus]|uniref:uncharacterized protein LOC129588009 n=1 Tax=Paramacrobiotus metropolitanus TaxID=2943436 RepID=UPI002445CE4F|nr:uncharacterized protein LOC129588009 [Paramacrobiotus metropolitanus]